MTVFFPDVSHYQAGLRLTGAIAVIAKASQGTGYLDPAYAGFKAQAGTLGIPFCAYHWLDTTPAAAQAAHAYSVIGPHVPVMIDDEQGRIDVGHTLAFVAAYRALGGSVVLEYAPHWLWDSSGRPDLRPLTAAGLSLISSAYPAGGYPLTDNGPGWAPYGGVTPAIWQYTDKQQFGGQHVDFNAIRGTAQDLRALLGLGGTDMADGFNAADRNALGTIYNLIAEAHTGDVSLQVPAYLHGQSSLMKTIAALASAVTAPAPLDVAALAAALVADPAFAAALEAAARKAITGTTVTTTVTAA